MRFHPAVRCIVIGLLGATWATTAQAQLDSGSLTSLADGWTAAYSAGRYKEAEEFALRLKANDR